MAPGPRPPAPQKLAAAFPITWLHSASSTTNDSVESKWLLVKKPWDKQEEEKEEEEEEEEKRVGEEQEEEVEVELNLAVVRNIEKNNK